MFKRIDAVLGRPQEGLPSAQRLPEVVSDTVNVGLACPLYDAAGFLVCHGHDKEGDVGVDHRIIEVTQPAFVHAVSLRAWISGAVWPQGDLSDRSSK